VSDLASFRVWVLDSDGAFFTSLRNHVGPNAGSQLSSDVPSWTVTPASAGWVNVNVTDLSNPIIISGDFYLAIEFTTSQQPRLGIDTTGPKSNRGWFIGNQTVSGWIEYSAYARQQGLPDGNLMIRALTAPLYDTATTTTNTSGAATTRDLTFAIPAAIIIIAAGVVLQLARRRRS
jgi:hypothetical protein